MANLKTALLGSTVCQPQDEAPPITNAVASSVGEPRPVTLAEIKRLADWSREALRQPSLIGDWLGCEVYVDPLVSPGEIIVRDPATNEVKMRFSVDHPTIQGTKMERAARRFLSPIPVASPGA